MIQMNDKSFINTELINYLEKIKGAAIMHCETKAAMVLLEFCINDKPILIWIDTTWRLSYQNNVISTDTDYLEDSATDVIADAVQKLKGKKLLNIIISPFYDVVLEFTDNFILKIFCLFRTVEKESNWELWIPEEDLSFEIANDFKIKTGKYYS